MYKLFRPFLFLLPPERIHSIAFRFLRIVLAIKPVRLLIQNRYFKTGPELETTLFGIKFPNKVGLAAGFDKDAVLGQYWQALGFGFIEIGTVTPKPQHGNPKPRLFRLPEDFALINRMGFNNKGCHNAANNLETREKELGGRNMVIGGNIGRNKTTDNENAISDYLYSLHALHPFVDYIAINVSSPNTPGLRSLQEKEPLLNLIVALQKANAEYANPRPLLLKISPDLNEAELDDVIDILKQTFLDGVIATNTTISRSGLLAKPAKLASIGAGGLSGKPLNRRSTEIITYLRLKLGPKFPIIAVGGIMTAQDAAEKIKSGANLVQIYTGFVYEGPALVKEINSLLARK